MCDKAALQASQVSVLHTILNADSLALSKAADSGAIQALFPIVKNNVGSRPLALVCLTMICQAQKVLSIPIARVPTAFECLTFQGSRMRAVSWLR